MALDVNDPEVKAAIEAAVAAEIAPLAAKRDELLAEVRKLKAGKQINPEDFAALEADRDALKGQLDKTAKDLKTAQAAAEKATKAFEAEAGFTSKLLADNGLSDALVKVGVSNPVHLKAVKAMLGSQVQIIAEGDQRIAKVGDKPLADWVATWAQSDEGKNFITANNNAGGGANGGSGNAGGKKITRAEFETMQPADRAAALKGGATLVD